MSRWTGSASSVPGWLHTARALSAWYRPAGRPVLRPVTRRGTRLYLHLVMRPTDLLSLRQVPVWRIRRVTLLGRRGELSYEHNMDVQAGPDSSDDARGEVLIDAGEPTGALHDVVAVDFDRGDAP